MKKMQYFILLAFLLTFLCSCAVKPSEPITSIEPSGNGTEASDAVRMEDEQAAANEFDPFSEEFSLWVNGKMLKLGEQAGNFPWQTDLQEEESRFWSTDGFHCFEIICTDGTILSGLRQEGADDATDGMLFSIVTGNRSY